MYAQHLGIAWDDEQETADPFYSEPDFEDDDYIEDEVVHDEYGISAESLDDYLDQMV